MDSERISERDTDLALAAELQSVLLPRSCPSDCPNHVVAARNRMCTSIGGDFYDFIKLNDDQLALVVGDVIGHGIRAALIMTQIMGYLRSRASSLTRPTEVATELNEMLIELGAKVGAVLPCSLVYGVVDWPTGTGFFVNAGHPVPIICNRERETCAQLGQTDMLLGIEEYEPTEVCYTFVPGERMVLFTDGVLDALNAEGEPFGAERLGGVICEHVNDDPEGCVEGCWGRSRRFAGRRRRRTTRRSW